MLSLLVSVCLLLSRTSGGPRAAEALNQTDRALRRLFRDKPPPLLGVPVIMDSHQDQSASPRGTGQEAVPEQVRELLLPVWPNISPLSVSGVTVRTSCARNRMQLQVDRSIIGSEEPDSLLRLGTCRVSQSTGNHFYFDYDLSMCGTKRTTIDNRMVYFNVLHYNPPKPRGPIRRALPFSLPVACYFNRYIHKYKVGHTPKVQIHEVSKHRKNTAKVTLTALNAQWEKLSSSDHFVIGDPLHFEAKASTLSHHERLYVHTCYISQDQSHTATPQFPIMKNFGCMVEKKSGRSRFIKHKQDAVRFSVDSSSFKGMTEQPLYLHCIVSVEGSARTPSAKSCSYNAKDRKWVELFGLDSVCDCCDSICSSTAPSEFQVISSRPWTIESKGKGASSVRRKTEPVTTETPQLEPGEWSWKPWPAEPAEMLRGKVEQLRKELDGSFGDGGVSWFDEAEEKHVKGSAVVEEDEKITEPHRIFEEIFHFDGQIPA
ncbi:zona pellucida sperm-binding protein 3d.2 [Oryzias melastigma]|uniref:Zona pellucida sperm-binding protein 3 n=1 Tax=Oryzias melastigma TaxID=30732 RepID=A0A3B3CJ05_ORYME|nr:zona pellucida sperm-binding protein 3d.2 [Oryzias melastigma]